MEKAPNKAFAYKRFHIYDTPSRGLLIDCEIFANLCLKLYSTGTRPTSRMFCPCSPDKLLLCLSGDSDVMMSATEQISVTVTRAHP